MPDSLLQQGIAEFNRGHFFEAHELWEEAWNEVVGEEKRFYQGLVQLAAGYHKLSLAQYSGARKLLERSNQTLSDFPATYSGINLTTLRDGIASTLGELSKKSA